MNKETLDKKQQLVDELDRLATLIEALTVENSKLKDVIDTFVQLVEESPHVNLCWVDKRDYSVHVVWNWSDAHAKKAEQQTTPRAQTS